MKKISLILMFALFTGSVIFTSCETDPFSGGQETSILPDQFSVDVPDAISKDASVLKGVTIDTLSGNEVYRHLTFFIRIGESAAEITESIIWSIKAYDIDRIKTLSYESAEDGRIKNLVVEAAPEYDGRVWDYGLTITDADSEVNEDGGKAMQLFWDENPRAGIALLKPFNINRKDDAALGQAMFRIDYSEEGENGYDAHMIVSVADLPMTDPLLDMFSMNAMKMFVGKKGEIIDVYGNSSHPNARFFTATTGYNWAFVASAEENRNVAVAEIGLPLSTLDTASREILLVENSIKQVFTNAILEVWPDASQDLIDTWLTNTEAPGYFSDEGFIQGGEMPGEEYGLVDERIRELSPYNPYVVANLELSFK